MSYFLIAVTYIVILCVGLVVWRWWWGHKALTRPYGRYQGRWGGRQFIPGPGGMFPVPFDDELQASRDDHPPLHGTQRANGERYCVRCGAWFRDPAFAITDHPTMGGTGRRTIHHRVCGMTAIHPDDLTTASPLGDPEPESYF